MAELNIKPTPNKVFLSRLYLLITDGGLLVYRKVFTDYATRMSGSVSGHLDRYRLEIRQGLRNGNISRTQFERLFPGRNPVESVDTCDITLLAFLVRITCVERTVSTSLRQQISELDIFRTFRNEIAHISSTEEYDRSKFEEFWQRIKDEIIRQGQGIPGLEEQINELKDGPIDPKREAELQEGMENLRRSLERAEDLIANQLSQLAIDQKKMQQKIDSNQTDIMTRFDDESIARKKDQAALVEKIQQNIINPLMSLPSPGFCGEQSTYSKATEHSSSYHGEHVQKYKVKNINTGVTYVGLWHRTVAKGTVTAFLQSDYEDLTKVISSEWPIVAEHLELSKIQIDSIKAKFEGDGNQAFIEEMIQIWEDMLKGQATIERFINVVADCLEMNDDKINVIVGIKGRHCDT